MDEGLGIGAQRAPAWSVEVWPSRSSDARSRPRGIFCTVIGPDPAGAAAAATGCAGGRGPAGRQRNGRRGGDRIVGLRRLLRHRRRSAPARLLSIRQAAGVSATAGSGSRTMVLDGAGSAPRRLRRRVSSAAHRPAPVFAYQRPCQSTSAGRSAAPVDRLLAGTITGSPRGPRATLNCRFETCPAAQADRAKVSGRQARLQVLNSDGRWTIGISASSGWPRCDDLDLAQPSATPAPAPG